MSVETLRAVWGLETTGKGIGPRVTTNAFLQSSHMAMYNFHLGLHAMAVRMGKLLLALHACAHVCWHRHV